MNVTQSRLQVLWEMCNDQVEGINKTDTEYLCEQWWAEIEWPDLTI